MNVFLSYSRRDAVFVGRLADDLVNRGIDPWLDTDDLPAEGEDRWRRSVVRGIRDSTAIILVLSPDSVGSKSVERELTIAAEMGRRIIPIMNRTCTLSDGVMFELAGLQRTDFVDQPYETAFEELVQRIHADAEADPASLAKPDRDVETVSPVGPRGPADRPSAGRSRRWLAAAAVLCLATVVVVVMAVRSKPDEGSGSLSANSSVGEQAELTTATTREEVPPPDPGSVATDGPLVSWDVAFATLERRDGTTAIARASSLALACTAETLEFMNGQRLSLELVESIQFDAASADTGSADGVVTLLDGREFTDPIRTRNCPIQGTTELGPISIPLEDIERIDFSR